MKFRVSSDGNTLDLVSCVDEHNHDRNQETHSLLPRQRQLDIETREMVQHMLKLRVNKKLLQAELLSSKKVLLKDLHNLNAKKDSEDSLQDTLKYLQNKDGNIVEIVSNEENQFLGLFYQDIEMQRTYSTYPEILFVDAIYKVSNLRIPLYILIVEDGNGNSEIVALMLLASEDALTIDKMVEVFKKHNPAWENTVTIMTDKDFQERKSFKNGFQRAEMLICLFHTLRSFKREINCEKMGISSGERVLYQEYAQKLTYSKNEDEYNSIYDEIKRLKLIKFIDYFEKNWHPIKEEWVPALQTAVSFGNRTNNRLESINSKVMQVVQRHSRLPDLFKNLECLLLSLRAERDGKAAKVLLKVPLNVDIVHEDESCYLHVLTPYAFGLIHDRFALKDKVQIVSEISISEFQIASSQGLLTTSESRCSCRFFYSYNLPCHHVLHVREKLSLPLFDSILVPQRWTKEFYLNNSRLMLTDTTRSLAEAVITQSSVSTKKVLSQNDKYRMAITKIQKIATLASEVSSRQFPQRMQVLNDIIRLWELDKEVSVVEVETFCGSEVHLDEVSFVDPPEETHQENLDQSSLMSHEHILFDENPEESAMQQSSLISNAHILDHDYASPVAKSCGKKSSTNTGQTMKISHDSKVSVENNFVKESSVVVDIGSFNVHHNTFIEIPSVGDLNEGLGMPQTKLSTGETPVLPLMPKKMKQKGRPKGANSTVIGLPRKKGKSNRMIPFERKKSRDRQLLMLQWFITRDRAFLALDGQVVEKHEVEVNENKVSSGCLDSRCEIKSIRKYFTSDAWKSIESLVKFKRNNHPFFCSECKLDSCEDSVSCSGCLENFHLRCSGVKVLSKSKKWYCRRCYSQHASTEV
ncbi:uncharacterized protein LOC120356037 [Nilaparvata lugens]|uniref:uncharacterized protein LOC120356037 n=1 Tax=Nilaparvata lugens TaxID=108931 RepID=UPI00193DCC87|nr:uncharacterized protein LOC120356037 [Nilaparvata lugens]